MSFSDQNMSFSSLSYTFHIFILVLQNHWTKFNQTWNRRKSAQISAICHFHRGDNSLIMKINLQLLKISPQNNEFQNLIFYKLKVIHKKEQNFIIANVSLYNITCVNQVIQSQVIQSHQQYNITIK